MCEVIEQYLPRMTSLNQLGLIIHALGITYSILCMHDRAHHIFSILTNSESKTSAFSVLRDINPFYQEYYTRKAEKYSNDMEKERRTKLALVKDRKLLRLRLIRAALDQEMNLNSDRSRSMSRSMSMSMSDSSKDGYESNDAKNDSEVKDYNSPTASQSFSTVITAVIKAAQATTWMRKMMKQKKLEYLKRSDMTNCPPDTPHDSNSELSYFIPLLAEKIAVVSMPAKTSPNSSECHSSKTSTCNSPRSSTKFPAKNSTKDSPNDSEEAAAAPADVPFDIKATIRYQISLMTGRGLDGIKAEICVLNASALMDEVDISTSLLYNSAQPLTAAEYCQEGLKCVNYQIPHEYLLSKKFEPNLDLDPDFNSAHPNLVDLVHTLLVQARLLFILSKLPPEMPRCFTVPPFTSFSSPSATPPNTGRSNVSAAASPTVAMSPSSPPSTPLAASPVPIFPSHQLVINSLCGDKSTSIPTECDPIPVKPKDIRSSYTAQVDYVLRKCAALGRSANAPGATYLAGLKMIEYGLDVKYGRECLKEAMDIISTDQIERTRRRAMQTKVDKVILKFRSGSQDSFEQILLQEDINSSGSFKKEAVENIDVGSERDSEREGCYLRDSVPIYHLENIPLVIDAMKALGDTS